MSLREEIAEIIWESFAPEDYEAVPYEHVLVRPRYIGVRQRLDRTVNAIMHAIDADSPPHDE